MTMPAAIPTPYDIATIPYAAWVPGLWWWIAFGATTLGISLLMALRAYTARIRRASTSLLELLLTDLQNMPGTADHFSPERALSLAKRATSMLGQPDCVMLSPNELRRRANQAGDPAWQTLLVTLAELEESSYQPEQQFRCGRTAEQIGSVVTTLRELASRRRSA